MIKKRYALIRVDNKCPYLETEDFCPIAKWSCKKCKATKNYGDTRENIVAKIETAISRRLGGYKDETISLCDGNRYYCINKKTFVKELAETILEFMGVEK